MPAAAAEEARARLLELCPEGFEERESPESLELAAYVDEDGERCIRLGFGAVSSTPVADDWQERWREFHRGVSVGRLWIGPPWEQSPAAATRVVVDPGRAFGTGSHPTTRLCVELLARVGRGSLLDVGCGSGVLSIAAAKLGFAPVTALDEDPAAVEATLANASANGVALDVRLADALTDSLPAADTAVANVSFGVVSAVAERLHVERLVTSGYLTGDRLSPSGYEHVDRATLDGWAADLFARRRK